MTESTGDLHLLDAVKAPGLPDAFTGWTYRLSEPFAAAASDACADASRASGTR